MDLTEEQLQSRVEAGQDVYIWRLDCFLVGIPEPQCVLLFNKPQEIPEDKEDDNLSDSDEKRDNPVI